MPPAPRAFRLERRFDDGLLHGELLNIDFASPVVIAWCDDGAGLQFRWDALDHEDIRAFLADRRAPFTAVAARHPAEVRDPI